MLFLKVRGLTSLINLISLVRLIVTGACLRITILALFLLEFDANLTAIPFLDSTLPNFYSRSSNRFPADRNYSLFYTTMLLCMTLLDERFSLIRYSLGL